LTASIGSLDLSSPEARAQSLLMLSEAACLGMDGYCTVGVKARRERRARSMSATTLTADRTYVVASSPNVTVQVGALLDVALAPYGAAVSHTTVTALTAQSTVTAMGSTQTSAVDDAFATHRTLELTLDLWLLGAPVTVSDPVVAKPPSPPPPPPRTASLGQLPPTLPAPMVPSKAASTPASNVSQLTVWLIIAVALVAACCCAGVVVGRHATAGRAKVVEVAPSAASAAAGVASSDEDGEEDDHVNIQAWRRPQPSSAAPADLSYDRGAARHVMPGFDVAPRRSAPPSVPRSASHGQLPPSRPPPQLRAVASELSLCGASGASAPSRLAPPQPKVNQRPAAGTPTVHAA